MDFSKLFRKHFRVIPFAPGTSADPLSKFKKKAYKGEGLQNFSDNRFFIAKISASGTSDATVTELSTIDSLTNVTGAATALTESWNGKKQNIDATSNSVVFSVASGVIQKGFEARFIRTDNSANNFTISGADGVSVNGTNNGVVNYSNLYQNQYIDVEAIADNSLVVVSTLDSGVFLQSGNNLSDLSNVSTARTNLGLGTAATGNTGVSAQSVVALDSSAKLPAVDGSQLTNIPAQSAGSLSSYDFGGNAIYGTNSASITYTGNFTFASGNGGKNHIINSSTDVTGTMPSGFGSGIGFPILTIGPGAFVWATGAGTTINNRQSHTKTAGIYSVASLISYSADNYLFIGDTAT